MKRILLQIIGVGAVLLGIYAIVTRQPCQYGTVCTMVQSLRDNYRLIVIVAIVFGFVVYQIILRNRKK